ncbi:hypothetical protein ES707_12527 [subsurface metagenome]
MTIADTKKIPQVSLELGVAYNTILKWCQVLDYKKIGRDYFLTENQVEQLRAVASNKMGRPKKVIVKLTEARLRHIIHAVLEAKEKRNEIAIVGGAGWGNTFAIKIDPEISEKMFSKKLEAFAEK